MKATILTTLYDCKGVELAVTTVREPGESFADFGARHDAALKSALADC